MPCMPWRNDSNDSQHFYEAYHDRPLLNVMVVGLYVSTILFAIVGVLALFSGALLSGFGFLFIAAVALVLWRTSHNWALSHPGESPVGWFLRTLFTTALAAGRREPAWCRKLPPSLRPSKSQAQRLEAVRKQYRIGHENFLFHIAQHPESSRRVLRHSYENFKRHNPGASEHALLEAVLASRTLDGLPAGIDTLGVALCPDGGYLSPSCASKHPDYHEKKIREIVTRCGSIDALIDALVEEQENSPQGFPSSPSLEPAERQISDILAETCVDS